MFLAHIFYVCSKIKFNNFTEKNTDFEANTKVNFPTQRFAFRSIFILTGQQVSINNNNKKYFCQCQTVNDCTAPAEMLQQLVAQAKTIGLL